MFYYCICSTTNTISYLLKTSDSVVAGTSLQAVLAYSENSLFENSFFGCTTWIVFCGVAMLFNRQRSVMFSWKVFKRQSPARDKICPLGMPPTQTVGDTIAVGGNPRPPGNS